jgi:uncharacterized protein (TIGR01319 family)
MTSRPATILVTDIGSTTTKALLLVRSGDAYKLEACAHAPTTVEAPDEDVVKGLVRAARLIENETGFKLTDGEALAVSGGSFDFLTTSSAGGGLQILVSGLSKTVTAKSAFRAASAAGGIILDVLAVDDGRTPHEKVEAIESLRPDMILIAGGIDGGDISNVVRAAGIILGAHLKPKFTAEGRMPVIFAGNTAAQPMIESLFNKKADMLMVDNLRPGMDTENLVPTRRAIHEQFTRHVMARAPGYAAVKEWATLPIDPTPVAVERMLGIVAQRRGGNILMIDIGGATTDVFSRFDEKYNRTVSANLGMSYSASNVMLEAGVENIMRWLPFEISEREVRNIVANKCISPAALPENETELEIEQAVAREALRLALKTHRDLSISVLKLSAMDRLKAMFRPGSEFKEEKYVRMSDVSLIFGSGGVLSHAPEHYQAAQMLIDGLAPVGITEIALDSVFMTPHLGMVAQLSEDAAYNTFMSECFIPLGACISFGGELVPGKHAADIIIRRGDEVREIPAVGRDLKIIQAREDEEFEIELIPGRKVNAGAGRGKRITGRCRGGAAGIVIDTRGRPIAFPEDAAARRGAVAAWRRIFQGAIE